mmetsp:Transcript_26996/g.69569  ORF Transcript_26996/g.69569 Transcript_26996/m.69569 type:complete len:217 (-) Transcript_26996:531-1181(-)
MVAVTSRGAPNTSAKKELPTSCTTRETPTNQHKTTMRQQRTRIWGYRQGLPCPLIHTLRSRPPFWTRTSATCCVTRSRLRPGRCRLQSRMWTPSRLLSTRRLGRPCPKPARRRARQHPPSSSSSSSCTPGAAPCTLCKASLYPAACHPTHTTTRSSTATSGPPYFPPTSRLTPQPFPTTISRPGHPLCQGGNFLATISQLGHPLSQGGNRRMRDTT